MNACANGADRNARVVDPLDGMRVGLLSKGELAQGILDHCCRVLGGVDCITRVISHPELDCAADGAQNK